MLEAHAADVTGHNLSAVTRHHGMNALVAGEIVFALAGGDRTAGFDPVAGQDSYVSGEWGNFRGTVAAAVAVAGANAVDALDQSQTQNIEYHKAFAVADASAVDTLDQGQTQNIEYHKAFAVADTSAVDALDQGQTRNIDYHKVFAVDTTAVAYDRPVELESYSGALTVAPQVQ